MRQQDMPAHARAIILAEIIVKSQFSPATQARGRRSDTLSINASLHRASAANSIAGQTKAMGY
jgi:hypothetical protein